MGRFFTNLQVHVGSRPPGQVRSAIVDLLERDARAAGLVAVETPAAATRVIAVGRPDASRWIPVLDEATEDQGTSVDRLASELSKALETYVVSILVHDSDVLDLRLFDRGRPVDRFVNLPDYFRPVSTKKRRAVSGHSERWTPVVASSESRVALERAFATKGGPAETTLAAIARSIGLVEWYDEGVRDLVASGADGAGWMCFAPSPAERAIEPAPGLEATSLGGQLTLVAGEALRWSVLAVNRGGRVQGLDLSVRGSALDRGVVEVRRAHLGVPGPRGAMARSTVDFENGRGGAVRSLDADVPAPSAVTAAPQVMIAFEGRAVQAGRGSLEARVAPLGDRARASRVAVDVLIQPALRAPLRASTCRCRTTGVVLRRLKRRLKWMRPRGHRSVLCARSGRPRSLPYSVRTNAG